MFSEPNTIDPSTVNRTYYFTQSNQLWVPYLKIKWPALEEPTCPHTRFFKDFDNVGTDVDDGVIRFEDYENFLNIFDVEAMKINRLDTYNVTLHRIFSDGAAYFGQGALSTISGEIESDSSFFSVSRSMKSFLSISFCYDHQDFCNWVFFLNFINFLFYQLFCLINSFVFGNFIIVGLSCTDLLLYVCDCKTGMWRLCFSIIPAPSAHGF